MDANLTHGDDMPGDCLSETNWKVFKDPILGTLIHNFFITYFGQVLPHVSISDDEIKAKLVRLGTGYALWANTANDAVDKLDNILSSEHLNPSRSTLNQLGMLSPFLLLRQTAPLAL